MGVAQDERAIGADVVDVIVAVDIDDVRPVAQGNDRWVPADGAEGADGA
jgi:hypothetical protein